ncbi:MAG: flippase-like domain-containing protein [Syntrophobacteraceae bacterium]
MKKFHTATIILGATLLIFLVLQIGPENLWKELYALGWGLVPLILIEGVADIFHTVGWRHCLTGPHRSLPFFRLFRIRMAGFSINYLTPTGTIGGEVAKGALLSSDHRSAGAVTGVVIGKLAYTFAQLILVSVGSIITLRNVDLPFGVWPALLASSALVGLGIFLFLLVQKYGKLGGLVRLLASRKLGGPILEKAAQHITAVDNELKTFYSERPKDLPIAMAWHILGMSCGIVQSWYFLFLLMDHPSFAVAAGIWFLGSWFDLLTFAVPMGIGVQEAARILIFKVLGYGSVMGLTFGVTLRVEQIFWAACGLLCYSSLITDRPARGIDAGAATLRDSN